MSAPAPHDVVVLGIFVADCAFIAPRLPQVGETLLGNDFRLGPGGKGSNQAVAAARAGGRTAFLTRLGSDSFAEIARGIWAGAGVDTGAVIADPERPTGAAFIFVAQGSGENAIIVVPGAAAALSPADVEAAAATIRNGRVLLTQLEQPVESAHAALAIARSAGVRTVLNPAPALSLPADMLALCDVVTPNETEAAGLTGIAVTDLASARAAGEALLARGVGAAVITLGANGALLCEQSGCTHVPAVPAGAVLDTTGAGDAFAGAFAVALAEGLRLPEAVRFGCAGAGISVTRAGTAPAMPARIEIDALLSSREAS